VQWENVSVSTAPRPRQTTVAGALVIVGSLLVVATVWDQISRLHSLDTRESVTKVLADPPFDGLGLSVDGTLTVLHVLGMVAAGCAVAAVGLGWHALQRSRSSLIALSVVAVPLFLAGSASGGAFPTLVAVAVAMLWLQPSRDWFAGREPRPPATPVPPRSPTLPPGQPGAQAPVAPPYQLPAPPRVQQPMRPPVQQAPQAWGQPAYRGTSRQPRPSAVLTAAVVTWIGTGVTALMLLASAVVALDRRDQMWDEVVRRQPRLVDEGFTRDSFAVVAVVVIGIALVWCVVAAGFALLTLLGMGWARIGLALMAALSTLFLMVASLFNVLCLLPMVVAVAVVALLMRPEVVAWFSARRPPGRPGPGA
jgi:hypothetical protein